mmetsp:Transcript_7535/g.20993  ORF Transcript_7535/g.20993 Transcript_7535/m.20993 type:complete len:97 (+) Transcript_7535:1881-2171(+)|eukprot:CAMPEP_0181063304 /NCGR_PEP_ID=MMETSP1070-20121207/23572_1 /TAXON_ID=265543 /ORGANISM="Minutocellus polymorphus, Strain NH13" /LENGTH=96 /DNA_ID=CAMNT_0023143495 /DNA_START=2201 /DNA_END=2491 /DNA_ORIENTATION=+
MAQIIFPPVFSTPTKARFSLKEETAHMLLYCYHNLRLLEKYEEKGTKAFSSTIATALFSEESSDDEEDDSSVMEEATEEVDDPKASTDISTNEVEV